MAEKYILSIYLIAGLLSMTRTNRAQEVSPWVLPEKGLPLAWVVAALSGAALVFELEEGTGGAGG